MSIQELEFRKYIVEAKRAAYASGSGSKAEPARPGAKDLPRFSGEYAFWEGFPEFLNECLKEINTDAPYRGPAFRKYEDFE